MEYPPMYLVRQSLDTQSIPNVAGTIREEFSKLDVTPRVKSGQKVAVAVGSRGISRLATIVATMVECLRGTGFKPFIVPAMGSHGGATAGGQVRLLDHLGVNESSVGAPIVSTMDVVPVGRLESGVEVVVSRDVLEADHVVVINRIKPHTAFRGEVESGLCKMLAVGCGKEEGAQRAHKFGLARTIIPAARIILREVSVLFGLAIVENALGEIHTIRCVGPERFIEADKELLHAARKLLPRIPTNDLDILIVDEMGKNISGAGIDPNVIGFWRRDGGPKTPAYRTIIVLDLTRESNGNALGIGMVDLTSRRVMDKVDLAATYTNTLTTGIWRSAALPITLETDRAVLEKAFAQVPYPERVRMVRIVNTLRLQKFWVTEALLPELGEQVGVTIDEVPVRLRFDDDGRLLSFENQV